MSHYHAVVWIDHAEAHVLEFTSDAVERKRVRNPHPQQVHHKAGGVGSGKAAPDAAYLKDVASNLADAKEILVLGPGNAKLELLRYLHRHAPSVEANIVGVETADHPTDAQAVAHARKYFAAADRMQPQL